MTARSTRQNLQALSEIYKNLSVRIETFVHNSNISIAYQNSVLLKGYSPDSHDSYTDFRASSVKALSRAQSLRFELDALISQVPSEHSGLLGFDLQDLQLLSDRLQSVLTALLHIQSQLASFRVSPVRKTEPAMANAGDLTIQPAFLNLVEPFAEPSPSRGVHDFIKELEGVGRLAQWSDQQTVDAIFARLRGKALQFATRRLKPTDSLDTIKSNLIKEFTPAEAPLSSALAF